MELIPPDGAKLAGRGGGGTRARRGGSLGGRDARSLARCAPRAARVPAGLRRLRGVRAAATAPVPRDRRSSGGRSSRTGSSPLLDELRTDRRCFVHGDYSLKNMLVGPDGQLGARLRGRPLRQPGLRSRLLPLVRRALGDPVGAADVRSCARSPTASCRGYDGAAGAGFAGDRASVTAHTAALMLARTDGKSPAQFLDPPSRERAREAGIMLLRRPGARDSGSGSDRRRARVGGARLARHADGRVCGAARGRERRRGNRASGASTGSHEAHERRDGGERYGGKGVRRCGRLRCAAEIARCAHRAATPSIRRGSTPRFVRSTAPPNSRGSARTRCSPHPWPVRSRARGRGLPLWQALCPDRPPLLPLPMVNVISGGAHAGGLIDVQDFLVVPVGARTFAEAIEWASRVRAATAAVLRERGHDVSLVADEGGLAAPLPSNRAALDVLLAGIERSGLEPGAEAAIADRRRRDAASRGRQIRAREREPQSPGRRARRRARRLGRRLPDRLDRGRARRGRRRRLAVRDDRLAGNVQLLGDDLFVTSPERSGPASGTASRTPSS